MIYYFCPDVTVRSAGIRILYRHVEILLRHGFQAAILHQYTGFQLPDLPSVPVQYLFGYNTVSPGDIIVIPEGCPRVMEAIKGHPVRRMAIALNWRVYLSLLHLEAPDWPALGIERVLTHSPFIAQFIQWAMQLPVHVFSWGIREDLYFYDPREKLPQATFLSRKQGEIHEFLRLLYSRNPDFLSRIQWLGLDGLAESDYAEQIRRSSLFLNLSPAEGLPCSLLEAMRCGTIVAGYNSVGGQRELVGGGPEQNCILTENLDYVTLARRLEPFLVDLLSGNLARWEVLRKNGLATAAKHTREAEERSVVSLWQTLLQPQATQMGPNVMVSVPCAVSGGTVTCGR
jgi:hypothetical protein